MKKFFFVPLLAVLICNYALAEQDSPYTSLSEEMKNITFTPELIQRVSMINNLKPLAEKGDIEAQKELVRIYMAEYKGVIDYENAKIWLIELTKQTIDIKLQAEANKELAGFYYFGHGVNKDYAKVRYYAEKAAYNDSADGQLLLGNLYFRGEGVEQNYEIAKYWFEKAAKQNKSFALLALGSMYEYGLGVEANEIQAMKLYQLACNKNDAKACERYSHLVNLK